MHALLPGCVLAVNMLALDMLALGVFALDVLALESSSGSDLPSSKCLHFRR